MLRVVKHWMSHGVRIFRVDNPHTKPVAFWEWLLKEIRRTDPDVIFLSEAFTRPPMMHGLGRRRLPPVLHVLHLAHRQVGARGVPPRGLPRVRPHDAAELLRQHPRHPARLPAVRRPGGVQDPRRASRRPGSPSWGVYAGYELFEHVAVKPGSEEYLDSEKYQIRIRDWDAAAAEGRTLAPYLTRLNEIRRAHPALQLLRNVAIHCSDDENVLVFSKRPARRRAATSSSSWSTSTRTPPGRPRSTSTCPRSGWTGATRSWCTTRSPAPSGAGASTTTSGSTPAHEPAHVLTVRTA